MNPSATWGGGYVTDVGYEHGYYREQSPGQLRAACLLAGLRWEPPAEGAHLLELGCGQGVGALVAAAANPSWRVTALDFNPAHVAAGRALARAAGLPNVAFVEADLTDFAETAAAAALPEADIVTMHGVWSWVSPAVREGIVRLLRAKVAPGGVVHVSYNALPGWQGLLGAQRIVRETGIRLATRSDRQAQAGFEVLDTLLNARPEGLGGDPRLRGWLSDLGKLSPFYLAHEFMNAHWSPCWHADVATALAGARLDWAGAATLLETFPELAMTPEQRAVYDRFEDPLARELVKDACLSRTLRHDVYVRGARRLPPAARDAALAELTLGLSVPAASVALEVSVGAGKAELSPAFYGPVVARLAQGPCRVAELLRLPGAHAKRENPAELVGMLVGSRQAVVVGRPGAGPGTAALRLNAAFAAELARPDALNRGCALASEALGGGVIVATPALYAAGRAMAGEDGTGPGVLDRWVAALDGGLDAEDVARLRDAFAAARDETLPVLRSLGCLPQSGAARHTPDVQ